MCKLHLIYMLMLFSYMKCSDPTGISIQCQNCYDRECISREVHKIALKKIGKKIESFQRKIVDEGDFFIISYINQEYHNAPFKKGGGEIMLKISKKECQVVEYKRFK